jgi:hypothetical protein
LQIAKLSADTGSRAHLAVFILDPRRRFNRGGPLFELRADFPAVLQLGVSVIGAQRG